VSGVGWGDLAAAPPGPGRLHPSTGDGTGAHIVTALSRGRRLRGGGFRPAFRLLRRRPSGPGRPAADRTSVKSGYRLGGVRRPEPGGYVPGGTWGLRTRCDGLSRCAPTSRVSAVVVAGNEVQTISRQHLVQDIRDGGRRGSLQRRAGTSRFPARATAPRRDGWLRRVSMTDLLSAGSSPLRVLGLRGQILPPALGMMRGVRRDPQVRTPSGPSRLGAASASRPRPGELFPS